MDEYAFNSPDHYRLAALSRRKVIEDLTGLEFRHLELPDRPYLMKWRCPNDHAEWHLSAVDTDTTCAYCGSALEPYGTDAKRFLPLVNNYIGGREEYYGYAGQIKVGKMNIDQNPLTASQYDIMSTPTMILFKNGKQINKLLGSVSKQEIENHLRYVL